MITGGIATTFEISAKAGTVSEAGDIGCERIHKEKKMQKAKFYSLRRENRDLSA